MDVSEFDEELEEEFFDSSENFSDERESEPGEIEEEVD